MTRSTRQGRYDLRLYHERLELLHELDRLLDKPLIALSVIWLVLTIGDLTSGLSPGLIWISQCIWALFILDFLLELILAPDKLRYLKQNWLTVIAIFLPALRVFRAFRLFRANAAMRSIRFMRLVTSVRRGIGALNRTLKRRGFGYVVLLSCILTLAFAAGMLQFESRDALQQAGYGPETSGFRNYTDALWWCAMMMTTMGSDHWPVTAGGRLLCWLLAVYAFTVFGYITAFLATWFLQADKGASR